MYNKVILVGRLTRDIELRYTQGGMAVANTAIATNHNYSSNGEKKEEVCYTDITFFARSAEIANQYLRKGSQILVEGRLKFDKWVDQSGQNRSKHSVVVETMKMLDSKGENQGGYNSSSTSNADSNNQGGGYQAHAQNNGAQSYNQAPQQQTQSYQQQQQPSYGNNEPRQQQQSYQQQASTQSRQMPSSDSVPVIDIDEDEIPF